MKTLHINVKDKIATYTQRDGAVVCGNTDYQIAFTFDSEWDEYPEKTARFIWNGRHFDQPFKGDVCPMPIVYGTTSCLVGVYVENLETTTPAKIDCLKSVLCGETTKHNENDKVYADEAKEAAAQAKSAKIEAENAKASAEDYSVASAESANKAKDSETNAETSETNARNAESGANTAKVEAESAKASAENFADQAKTYAGEAKKSETASAGSANVATLASQIAEGSSASAANSATSAGNSAQIATAKASEAEASATSAGNSAVSAGESARTATAKASEAGASASASAESASTATAKANEAGASATAAANSATSAQSSAQTATTKANDAATSATNASASEANAKNAENGAKSAQATAESAASVAQERANETASALQSAVNHATAAGESASKAATSEANARSSETNASVSATSAEQSASAAATSESNAKTSETNAASSASSAESSASSASASRTSAETAQAQAEAARVAAEKARDDAQAIVGGDFATNTDVSNQIGTHNTNTAAHNDIRLLISGLTERLNALANSDDVDLDQMKEIVLYIKSNRDLISQITTNKVNVADIVNDLATNVSNKPLSAAQGVALKALIDAITIPVTSVNGKTGAVQLGAGDVGALSESGGTVSGNIFLGTGAIPSSNFGAVLGTDALRFFQLFGGEYYFANVDPNHNSPYKFGMYQWDDNFTFVTRWAEGNSFYKDAWQINGSTAVTNFTERPTVAGADVALRSEIPQSHSAGNITAGTFAGQVVANASGQAAGTSLLRNSKLVNAETNPTVNGEICWTFS